MFAAIINVSFFFEKKKKTVSLDLVSLMDFG